MERRKARAVFADRPTEGLVAPAGAPSPSDARFGLTQFAREKSPRELKASPEAGAP